MQESTVPWDRRKRALAAPRRAAGGALAVLLLAAVGACSTTSASAPSTSSTGGASPSAAVLGAKNPAKGQPVKIGFVTDGETAATNNSAAGILAPAVASYLNEYKGGIGGRPIQLDTCTAHGDPASTTTCGDQMVQDNVAAVVMGPLANTLALWKPLHDAKIPEFTTSATSTDMLGDPTGVFILDDPLASLLGAPAALAKSKGLTKVTQVVIDVPAGTAFMKTLAPAMYQRQGLHYAFTAVPEGTADMTPQMQRVASSNPGVVQIIGDDTFCTAALNGLKEVAFKGTIAVISECVSAATRQAVGSYLHGVVEVASSPTGDSRDPGVRLLTAIIGTYAKGKVDPADAAAESSYTTMMAMGQVLQNLTGPVTPATVTAHVKAMPTLPLPLGAGLTWRCNGKADPLFPAVCTTGALETTLSSDGLPTTYQPIGQ